MSRQPLVSINIPCYRQLHYARRAVGSILAQSFGDFELTLFDDGASDEYREFVEALADPRVRYQRNPARLGSMRNMFGAIQAGSRKYSLAFHEDDLLGTRYLEAAVEILEADPTCGFVAGELREFTDGVPESVLSQTWDRQSVEVCTTGADYLRAIFRGSNPMFGSIVYRRAALAGVTPAHELYATLVDRPFLLSILEKWSAAIVHAPLVWYRHHGEGDTRHLDMAAGHVLRLFDAYRAVLPRKWTREDRRLFESYAGHWLFELYRLTPVSSRPSLQRFLYQAWRRGVFRPALGGPFGVKRLGRALLSRE